MGRITSEFVAQLDVQYISVAARMRNGGDRMYSQSWSQ